MLETKVVIMVSFKFDAYTEVALYREYFKQWNSLTPALTLQYAEHFSKWARTRAAWNLTGWLNTERQWRHWHALWLPSGAGFTGMISVQTSLTWRPRRGRFCGGWASSSKTMTLSSLREDASDWEDSMYILNYLNPSDPSLGSTFHPPRSNTLP